MQIKRVLNIIVLKIDFIEDRTLGIDCTLGIIIKYFPIEVVKKVDVSDRISPTIRQDTQSVSFWLR